MLAFMSQKRINLILSQQLNTTLFRTFKFWAAVGDAFYYYKTDYTKKIQICTITHPSRAHGHFSKSLMLISSMEILKQKRTYQSVPLPNCYGQNTKSTTSFSELSSSCLYKCT